ncbi:MAG: signal peptidase I [Pirellulaceae bacterium]|jgi:signal peptidase I|nr:signal peptidase I [Pirellulaceae bacterium]
MSAAAPPKSSAKSSEETLDEENPTKPQGTRETIESIIVAFILAFLFRAFVAEAFVIPTGSMAPTLMGAHKDLFCQHCGEQYQASASSEFNSGDQAPSPYVTVGSTCSTCRGLNKYDLHSNPNAATFSGDRILVSKFDYVLQQPKRWEVLVFKYPLEAHMNYIKRLIGLPGESLLIQEGDIYTQTADAPQWTIARKPPHKIRAMQQIVADTKSQPADIIAQGWPSLWQPLPGTDAPTAWKVEHAQEQWSAQLTATAQPQWLRYYHKFLDDSAWYQVMSGGRVGPVDPYSSTLITDYLAYNSSYQLERDRIYLRNGALRPEIDSDNTAMDVALAEGLQLEGDRRQANDGHHWVGDLAGEFDIEVTSDSGTLLLDLVEFGIHFRCAIDVATGQAKLSLEGDAIPADVWSEGSAPTAQTAVQGAGSYSLELANFDDQLVLWVNDRVVEFDHSTQFDSRKLRPQNDDRRPYWTEADPLDAAPLGIGGQDLQLTVKRARVYRDIYYIAVQGGGFARQYSDYDLDRLPPLLAAIPDSSLRGQVRSASEAISAVYAHPRWWDQTSLFSQRGTLGFQLEADQYFPMGDNSSHSSDARAWVGHNYVEQKYLLGKALLVFWPHTWNSPIPFTPNFARMDLIR